MLDGVDQDCDGGDLCWLDSDSDGYGQNETISSVDLDCSGSLESTVSSDCDDEDAAAHPGATEVTGDGIDEDCNGWEWCLADADDDGYLSSNADLLAQSEDADCEDAYEALATEPRTDCNDSQADVHPGVPEECNGQDDDCDGTVDGPESIGVTEWYADADEDGYTDPSVTMVDCAAAVGFAEASDEPDCNDADGAMYPGAEDVPGDGIDQDCDGVDASTDDPEPGETDDGFVDTDGDGVADDLDIETEEIVPGGSGGCGCATSAPSGLSVGAWGMLGALMVRFRRRRV
jgi:MYXO-CTERM domain-containing protein